MRYPNLRYGNPQEFDYYTQGRSIKEIAKQLRRSERCILNWKRGTHKIPFWVPEIMRLWHQEHCERMRQMNMHAPKPRLGQVYPTGEIFEFKRPPETTACEATANEEAFQSQQLLLYL
jgi:hypothetical protein